MIKTLFLYVFVAGLLLMVPFLAMQFTDEIVWDWTDFAVAGILLLGTGLSYELITRKAGNLKYRAAVAIALLAALLIIGVNLAVGIIGSENNPANLMYLVVFAVGIIGAFMVRFESHGMSRVMFVIALIPISAAIISLLAGLGSSGPIWPWDILTMNGFFAALFVGSALLFQKAAR